MWGSPDDRPEAWRAQKRGARESQSQSQEMDPRLWAMLINSVNQFQLQLHRVHLGRQDRARNTFEVTVTCGYLYDVNNLSTGRCFPESNFHSCSCLGTNVLEFNSFVIKRRCLFKDPRSVSRGSNGERARWRFGSLTSL